MRRVLAQMSGFTAFLNLLPVAVQAIRSAGSGEAGQGTRMAIVADAR